MKMVKSPLLGEKLKCAREAKGVTQAQAAEKLGVARTTLVAIEKGTRGLSSEDLVTLAELYGRSTNSLLSERKHVSEGSIRFRKTSNEADHDAIALLVQLGESVLEVESLLGLHLDQLRKQRLPPLRPFRAGRLRDRAEDLAREARHWLGVSPSAPLGNFAELLEDCWGVNTFARPISPKVSGAYLYDPVIGACILLNSYHPPSRRLWSLAHETGHLLTVREGASIDDAERAEETFSDYFAAELLLPAAAVRERFSESLDEKGNLSVYQLIHMTKHFRVSLEAMCRRLEQLDLAARGLHAWLKRSDISISSVGPVSQEPESPGRFVARVLEALAGALLSEGQAASMLGVDRLQLREWKTEFTQVPLGGERDA